MATYDLTLVDGQLMVTPPIPDEDEPVENITLITGDEDLTTVNIRTTDDMLRALSDAVFIYDGIHDGDVFTLKGQPFAKCQGINVIGL